MKKIILISTGVLLLFSTVGLWYYLFFFGVQGDGENIFTNFGIGGNAPEFTEDTTATIADDVEVVVPEATGVLRVLSRKSIAGMTFVNETTARFVERGTGHIYDIDLNSGTETQVSNTTLPKASNATFASSGNSVAITYEKDGEERIMVGTIAKNAFTGLNLALGATEAGFKEVGNTAYYLLETPDSTEGHAYDPANGNDTIIFSVPFGSVTAYWGQETYVTTKPSASLLGYVYKIVNGVPTFVTSGGFGLMTMPIGSGVVVTTVDTDTRMLSSRAEISDTTYPLALEVFPDKCTSAGMIVGDVVCGAALTLENGSTYPDDWYQGTVSQEDYLWSIDLLSGEATLITDPVRETGEKLDITAIERNIEGDTFLIINKRDNTLWLFTPKIEA